MAKTRKEFRDMIEWEGGLEAFLVHGYSPDDLPEEEDGNAFREIWYDMTSHREEYLRRAGWIKDLLEES